VARFYHEEYEKLLKRVLEKEVFDYVIVESVFMSEYLDLLKKSGIPVILRAPNVEYKIWEERKKYAKKTGERFYLKILSRQIKKYEIKQLIRYDAIFPVSPIDVQQIKTLTKAKNVFYVPTGYFYVDKDEEKIDFNLDHTIKFYYIGAFDWYPNLHGVNKFIYEYWERLYSYFGEKIEFHVAGKNMPKSLKEKKLRGVKFYGEILSAREFIKDKDFSIVPLWIGSGVKIKVIESLLEGKPVVATPKALEGVEIPEDYPFVFQTQEELVNSVKKLIRRDYEFDKLKEFARSRYTHISIAKEFIKALEKIK
jgi:hypothetical protein